MDYIRGFVVNPKSTLLYQIIFAVAMGITFSPWSYGLVYYIIFVMIWELLYGYFLSFDFNVWNPLERLGVVLAGFLGWIIGRNAVGFGPFSKQREQFIQLF